MAKRISKPGLKTKHSFSLIPLTGILVFTGLLYLKSLKGEFLNYDDLDNVVNNPMIRQFAPDHLVRFFSHAYLYMYAPLTFVTFALDYHISGLDPYFFKLTNLLLHLFNVTLVFFLSQQLFKNKVTMIIMTLLFAVHPLNADTVSWISARSNLLATLFYLLCLLFYLHYLEKKRAIWLVLVPISFLLSLMSKSAGIMLPITLFLFDYLEKRKITRKVILEKFPVFILSLVFGLVALYFRSDSGNPGSIMEYNLLDRILMICYSLAGYLFRIVVPLNLSAIYAYPQKTGIFLPFIFCMAPVILAALIFLVSQVKKMKRELIFGLLFFIINVLVTQLTLLEDGFMANRYGYLPGVGLIFIIAACFDHFRLGSKLEKTVSIVSMVFFLLLFSVLTLQRSQVWNNTLSLFNNAVEQSPGSAFAFNNRGIARYSENDQDGALSDYNQAISIFPRYSGAYYNRGIVYFDMKEFGKAQENYTTAIMLNPKFASCYAARGLLEMEVMQNDSLALADYSAALRLNPEMAQVYYNRGLLRLRMKNIQMACEDFHQVRRLGYSRADDLIRQFCE